MAGTLTRSITNKDWDHIALFIWVPSQGVDTLCVLEALAEIGKQNCVAYNIF